MVKRKSKALESSRSTVELLSEDEWMARRNTYMQRLADLRISIGFIEDAIDEYKERKKKQLQDEKWKNYLACDGQPNPSRPAEIRQFVYQLNFLEHESYKNDINWVLPVDERSILSHAPDRKDMTRRNLEKERPNIGQLYDDTVQRILETITRVDRVLRSDDELLSMPPFQVLELAKMPSELNGDIEHLFDKLTYRVICAPEAYMTTKGSILSNYCYNSSKFNFQIWGLQDVPIRFNYMKLPIMFSDLNCVGVTLQLPLSVLCDKLTLRCVHTFFDPLSQLSKSYELDMDGSIISPNCGLVDIADSVMTEWMIQMDIQEEIIMKINTQMEIYNEAMAVFEKAVAQRKKDQETKAAGKKPIPKPPQKPQELQAGMFPDPYKLFLEQDKQDCLNFFNENFHPDHLNLSPFEVNLRRFIIMGGVISLVFVRVAKHIAFDKFNITLHEDGRVLRKKLDVLDEPTESTRSSTNFNTLQRPNRTDMKSDLDMEDAPEFQLHLEPDELPFYFITFQVPNHLCLWGEPIVCQFVEDEIQELEMEDELVMEKLDKKQSKMRKTSQKKIDSLHKKTSSGKNIILLEEIPGKNTKPKYHHSAIENSVNIYRPSALAIVRQSIEEQELVHYDVVENFELQSEPLSRRRLHLLQQQCLPRIISSFKFPRDFKDDEIDEQATKKEPTTQLIRRRPNEPVLSKVTGDFSFNYEDQTYPERVFPKFPPINSLKLEKKEITVEDTSMYGFIQKLDNIKDKYLEASKKIAEQAEPTVRMSKRIYHELTTSSRSGRQSYIRRSIKQLDLDESTPEKDLEVSEPIEVLRKVNKDRPVRSSEPIKLLHWSTKFILESQFDRESKVLTVKTDRLGSFGFAYPRYTHFPFRHWELDRNEENQDEVIFTLDTYHVRVVFFISKDGIRCHAIDLPKEYIARPYKYIDIEEPVSDFVELRKRLQDMNLNVFAELDAAFYIDQGDFSQKHLAAELHIYDAIAVHIKLLKFSRSQWNRLATNRDLVLCLRNTKDVHDVAEVTVRITPETSTFVEVSEPCTEDLNAVRLNYTNTWRNIGTYSDLHQLINSMYPHATDVRNRDSNQMYYLRQLLQEIRPLSFS
ncbi:uncharacterized protein LOC108142276 [Drosophila elegans]|uniref:uncharacterized protein LOC108142276 n=1 Tax=Drosophila elegans TaxID=30023 RepID=UPI0007E836AD|nr:uncharacterized protein LOC108142276 [Drosophila elegans]